MSNFTKKLIVKCDDEYFSTSEIVENKSVGIEFIEWAEKYWHLEKIIDIENIDTFAGETCDYKYMREIFIQKIDVIIKSRL